MPESTVTAVTAVVATRNRGDSAVGTVESILANTHSDFDVLVVDQSTDDATQTALEPFGADARFRYLRSDTVGLGRAQNVGMEAIDSEFVVFTDDDCDVPPDWLEHMEAAFHLDSRIAVVYCNVVAAPHDRTAGFIPDYEREKNTMVTSVRRKVRARGIGAGMAVRRVPVTAIGGFDEHMGPGAVFASAGDRDLAIRAILRGSWVYETVDTAVVHRGFRTWEQGKELTKRDWIGLGAMCAKPIRAGHWQTVVYAGYEVLVNGVIRPFARLAERRRPQGFRRVGYFCQGFWRGWRTPIDRDNLVFVAERG